VKNRVKTSPRSGKRIIKTDSPNSFANLRASSGASRFSPYENSHGRSKGRTVIHPRLSKGGLEIEIVRLGDTECTKPVIFTRTDSEVKSPFTGIWFVKSLDNMSCASAGDIWLAAVLSASLLCGRGIFSRFALLDPRLLQVQLVNYAQVPRGKTLHWPRILHPLKTPVSANRISQSA